ncbi:MAG TPA: hypothetical protein PK643_14105, partial [Saprospiraceae bacterium]|nr:hypothetical protein [Saprospiraceae bacterium]
MAIILIATGVIWSCAPPSSSFQSAWFTELGIDRSWAGPEYWLNPLQAWRQKDGELQMIQSGGDRNC